MHVFLVQHQQKLVPLQFELSRSAQGLTGILLLEQCRVEFVWHEREAQAQATPAQVGNNINTSQLVADLLAQWQAFFVSDRRKAGPARSQASGRSVTPHLRKPSMAMVKGQKILRPASLVRPDKMSPELLQIAHAELKHNNAALFHA